MTAKREYLNACLEQSVDFLKRSYANPTAYMTPMHLKLHLLAIRKLKSTVVTLPDGYNGATELFFTAPLERDGRLVKLQCAAPGKQYLITWRAAADVAAALEAQA
jgi:hypothetical protein